VHYKAGIDLEAIAYRNAQAKGPFEQGHVLAAAATQDARRAQAADQSGRFVGSYMSVAQMLD